MLNGGLIESATFSSGNARTVAVTADSLVIDGNSINDPANRTVQTGFGNFQSMVVVPGPQPWLPANVPHGTIARHRFHSAIADDDRDFFVYTPPGYDAHRTPAYPTLNISHGQRVSKQSAQS